MKTKQEMLQPVIDGFKLLVDGYDVEVSDTDYESDYLKIEVKLDDGLLLTAQAHADISYVYGLRIIHSKEEEFKGICIIIENLEEMERILKNFTKAKGRIMKQLDSLRLIRGKVDVLMNEMDYESRKLALLF